MEIQEITQNILEARKSLAQLDEAKKGLTEKKKQFEDQLIEAMRSQKMKSVKTDDANFAITVKKDLRVTDEDKLIANLLERELDHFIVRKVDLINLKPTLRKMMNEDGEILDGTEPTESEYLTVKVNK